jgi:hypothetical protein
MGVRDDISILLAVKMPGGVTHRLNVNGRTRVRGCNHTACQCIGTTRLRARRLTLYTFLVIHHGHN